MDEKGLADDRDGLEISGTWPSVTVSNDQCEVRVEENAFELEQLGVGVSSTSTTESSEEPGEPTLIRQIKLNGTRQGLDEEIGKDDDEKLYLVGNFSGCYSESRNDSEFADEGIYQGLGTTDIQKKELGILPEAIYMTTKLIEKGAFIESLALSAAVSPIEVPEVPLCPSLSPIFTKQGSMDTLPLTGLHKPRPRSKYSIIIHHGNGSHIRVQCLMEAFQTWRNVVIELRKNNMLGLLLVLNMVSSIRQCDGN